jgi:hypothetical protein
MAWCWVKKAQGQLYLYLTNSTHCKCLIVENTPRNCIIFQFMVFSVTGPCEVAASIVGVKCLVLLQVRVTLQLMGSQSDRVGVEPLQRYDQILISRQTITSLVAMRGGGVLSDERIGLSVTSWPVFVSCHYLEEKKLFVMRTICNIRGDIQKFPDWIDNEIYAYDNRWEASRRVTATKLWLTHKIDIQLHLVAESYTICNSRFRRPVGKLLDTPSYIQYLQQVKGLLPVQTL